MWYLASGDSGFYFHEQLLNLSWLPRIWNPEYGFGISTLVRMWFDYPYLLMVKFLSFVGLNWWMIDKLMWMIVLCVAILSILKLSRVLSFSKIQSAVSCVIYCTNTYILLLFGGGQIGVALAYGLAPLVLGRFIEACNRQGEYRTRVKCNIQNGLWLALLIASDLRLAYLVVGASLLYAVISNRKGIYKKLDVFLLPLIIATLVHAFWILPMILAGGGGLTSVSVEYTGFGMLKFLSFADFSHSLSLLHPNWPDNFFGRIYFLQPEFLVVPVFAFIALLFIPQKKESKMYLLFFALLALIGAFLAKGVNPPVGGIFQWMFTHIPGFMMFRDPTKFYLFISLGYAVLIPYTVYGIGRSLKKFQWVIIYTVGLLFWCFTIRSVFLGQVAGNFKPLVIPEEYIKFKDVLVNDSVLSRTLWIPNQEKFAYPSSLHPVLSATTLFTNASISGLIATVSQQEFQTAIDAVGVKYIVVPIDVEKRMFLNDYKYDGAQREELIQALTNAGYGKYSGFNDIGIFINPSYVFTVYKPEIIEKQEYWVKIGLSVSVISILFFGFLSIVIYKKRS